MTGELRIGCSGWNYRDWRGVLYPEWLSAPHWLARYTEVFDTVEVNATFYRLPTEHATAVWAAQVPVGFRFAVKGSRYLTHVRRLRDPAVPVARFTQALAPLRDAGRLGPLLWQLPEDFHRDEARLQGLLAVLPAGRHALEFRHASWFDDAIVDVLAEHGVALVWGDHPERPFQRLERTADFVYVRLNRGTRGRRGNYSEAELRAWAARLAAARADGDVCAYCNNDQEGFVVNNARRLLALAGAGA
ncbi:MAG TPA: DUF72 domain-containing protein [Solirubrobacteraceae bacterium]